MRVCMRDTLDMNDRLTPYNEQKIWIFSHKNQ